MTLNSQGNRPTKNQRREQAREKARELRLETQKKERKRKVFVQVGVAAAILGVGALIALIVVGSTGVPGKRPANMASDGILLQAKLDANGEPTGEIEAVLSEPLPDGASPVTTKQDPELLNIVVYQDYQCPVCKEFEASDMPVIEDRVRNGAATLEIHPITFLDRTSLNEYSSRAANAAACVATYDPNNFLAFNAAMYANQPAESTAGPDSEGIKKIAEAAGVQNKTDVGRCIDDNTYAKKYDGTVKVNSWAFEATDRVKAANPLPNTKDVIFGGTPTILVNGQEYTTWQQTGWSAAAFSSFLLKLSSLNASTPTPTPSN